MAEPEYQTAHTDRYDAVIDELTERGLTYECYCSRRDILQAPRAPHAPEGAYPGTCRDLTEERARRTRHRPATGAAATRPTPSTYTVTDLLHGTYTGVVDDLVLRRGDGVPAYNLAVVVDDAAQGVDQVVRGDDLLSSSPRQAYLGALLGYPHAGVRPRPAGTQRRRQAAGQTRRRGDARRDRGADRAAAGSRLAGLAPRRPSPGCLTDFDPALLPREPVDLSTPF